MAENPAGFQNIINALCGACALLGLWVVFLQARLSKMQSRLDAMMTGEQTGGDFESILLAHVQKCSQVADENLAIRSDIKKIQDLLRLSVNRIGVVRFSAFKDTGSDLSYAVALLDQNDDGVVFSSIFGRDDFRSYAKPVKKGESEYKLTDEEKQAIREAKNWG